MKLTMKNLLLSALSLCLIFAGAACASEAKTESNIMHYSWAPFNTQGGVSSPDYGQAAFSNMNFRFSKYDLIVKGDENKTGTLKIGSDSFNVKSEETGIEAGKYIYIDFYPSNLSARPEGTYSEKNFSWTFNGLSNVTESKGGTLPVLSTTVQQLAAAAPYVEINGDSLVLKSVKYASNAVADANMGYAGDYRVSVLSDVPGGVKEVVSEWITFLSGAQITKTFSLKDDFGVEGKYIVRNVQASFRLPISSISGANHKAYMWYRWGFDVNAATEEVITSSGSYVVVIKIVKDGKGNEKIGSPIPQGSNVWVWITETVNPPTASLYGLGARAAHAAEGEYGPYKVTVEKTGEISLDFNNLTPVNDGDANSPTSLPAGTYSAWYEGQGDAAEFVGSTDSFSVGTGGSSNSSGCDIVSGLAFLAVPLLVLVKRKR